MCPRQQLQPAQYQHCLKQSWLFPEISITLLYESATSFPGFYHHTVESVDHLTRERITFKVDTFLRDNAVDVERYHANISSISNTSAMIVFASSTSSQCQERSNG